MKQFFIIPLTILLFSACTNSSIKVETKDKLIGSSVKVTKQNRLEVYCFHGTRQCETCKNMKANTKVALDKYFATQLKDSSIVFSIIDVDNVNNEKLAEKFQASGTALMINNVKNGKDSIIDWSDFAFENANNKDVYISGFKIMVEAVLKQK